MTTTSKYINFQWKRIQNDGDEPLVQCCIGFLLHDTAGVMASTSTHEHATQVTVAFHAVAGGGRHEGQTRFGRFSPVTHRLGCRKEPTTTVLQLAALAVARGHKACQWRTAVGRPVSFHIRHIFVLSCVCSHLNQRPLAKVRRHL